MGRVKDLVIHAVGILFDADYDKCNRFQEALLTGKLPVTLGDLQKIVDGDIQEYRRVISAFEAYETNHG